MKFRIKVSNRALATARCMNYRELINQVICPFHSKNLSEGDYGGVFFFADEKIILEDKINRYKKSCNIPSLIVSDMENGPGEMIIGTTKFPTLLGCSQADDPNLVYEMGKIAAVEAGELGYNWTLAPVADLLLERDNPITSTRSAGNNTEQVIQTLKAYINGLQDNGMAATIKHFPGDGSDIYDQHLTTTSNRLGYDTWKRTQGKVFQELIDSGVHFVMPGHIAFPAVDEKDEVMGLYPPATISKRLLTDLLKNEMGFEGLIVSDAINMSGVAGFVNYYEACTRFFEAGGDILLFPDINEAFYREMKKQLESGALKRETLIDRAARVLSYKEQIGLFDNKAFDNMYYDKDEALKVSEALVDKSITIVRDRFNILPYEINKETKVLYLVIMNGVEIRGELMDSMLEAIKGYTNHVECMIDPGPEVIFKRIYEKTYDLVICSVGCEIEFGLNVARLHGKTARNMMKGWTKLGVPVIFAAHYHPFFHKEYEAMADTVINTYGFTNRTAASIMEGITGRKPLKTEVKVHS